MNSVTIVAIAKDEAPYIVEWISYHLAIGADKIIIYDNESQDAMPMIIDAISTSFPVERVFWPNRRRISPQRSSYNDALSRISGSDWVAFIDIDEFIVPWAYADLHDFVGAIPGDISSLAMNWRCYGSSNVSDQNYGSVLKTFTRCAAQNWKNNKHIKTIARASDIETVHIHDVILRQGRKAASDFAPLRLENQGRTPEVVYGGVQVNHYQTKTFAEFAARMARGNANFPPGHPQNPRDGGRNRYDQLDRNDEIDVRVEKFLPAFDRMFDRVSAEVDPVLRKQGDGVETNDL